MQGQISEHIFLKSQRLLEAIVVIILQIFFATCSNKLEYLNISFKNSLPSKTFRAYMLFSNTASSTSRFISPFVTKTNRSPILTLILIVKLTCLEVF